MANTISWSGVLLLSLFWLQLLSVNGYFIDKSCERIEHKIKVSMRKAMEMAEAAQKEVEKEMEKKGNSDIEELRSWFFRDQDLPKMKDVYSSMQKHKILDTPDTDDVKQPTIYCTLNHLEERDEELDIGGNIKYLVDRAEKIKMDWHKGYDGCKNGDTVAFTSTEYDEGKKYLAIQLCPWYLNEIAGSKKFTNADGTLPDGSGKKNYNPHRDPSAGDPKADIWSSRLDFVLLHELVHALPDGHAIAGDPAYYWHPCIALGQNGGCLNPDSYAYFALGVRKIKDEGIKFTQDGMTVSVDDKDTKRSEQAMMKLWNA